MYTFHQCMLLDNLRLYSLFSYMDILEFKAFVCSCSMLSTLSEQTLVASCVSAFNKIF